MTWSVRVSVRWIDTINPANWWLALSTPSVPLPIPVGGLARWRSGL